MTALIPDYPEYKCPRFSTACEDMTSLKAEVIPHLIDMQFRPNSDPGEGVVCCVV